MIDDARQLPDGHIVQADVCIIGAGAAGITVGRELVGSKIRAVIVESGGFAQDEPTQSLYTGRNIGLPSFPLDVNRLRFFGGTTNHWAGHCRPLDAIDFEKRDYLDHSGWPITRADLEPYYARTQTLCELPEAVYEDLPYWLQRLSTQALPLDPRRLKTAIYHQSPPTRFGTKYRADLAAADTIRVLLNANVKELETTEEGNAVVAARCRCLEGPAFQVRAKVYVLATGGMENARILLLSNKRRPAGLGNEHDLVGRFFMDHLLLRPAALVRLTSTTPTPLSLYHDLHRVEGGQVFAVLAAPENVLRQERLGNFRIHLTKPTSSLATRSSLSALQKGLTEFDVPDELGAHIDNLLADLSGAANVIYRRIFGTNENLFTPKNDALAFGLDLVVEPRPNRNSRILLGSDVDLLGQRKIDVDWRVSTADLETARRATRLAAMEFGRLGVGRAVGPILDFGDAWPDNLEAGKHHCGTTRMAADPKRGVVDAECRVHSTPNLYVAGSSLFPTIGYANPTPTIVALALRLADHLKNGALR